MFVLFLILCYFILIFNIMIPKISMKLEKEHKAFLDFLQVGNNGILCVNNHLVTYSFSPSTGVAAAILTGDNKAPLTCKEIKKSDIKNIIQCDSDIARKTLRNTCMKAYAELFFAT
ncbi:IMV membrane protein [Sea otter poxvirus]|uniref:IMV membrane protein n=1 Tax=Sea otter poxvirus TaxID=1416741 RepID=A0A2U9QHS9_9POXV|nr:IMV membrane protein [Sea otter poxvirus]AWU47155.1 IMV membrane protein [Sea otter poxvirus]